MPSKHKRKGTEWETNIVDTLGAFFERRFGLKPRRVAQTGINDTGDVHGISPFVIQAKDDKSFRISEWLDGPKSAVVQARRAGEPYGLVVVKRFRRAVGDAYAIMRLEDWARVLLRLRRAEALLAEHAPAAFIEHATETTAEVDRHYPRASEV